jgi:Glycoside hydrolase family 44
LLVAAGAPALPVRAAAATITVTIDPGADRHPISPLIYGVNFGDDAQAARMRWPVRRWGGNATTRYSWQDDVANHASDWFFYNLPNDNPSPQNLPSGSASDGFVTATRTAAGEPLITVPTIGWTPIDRTRRWGFSVSKYGSQQATECTATGYASWCNPDAGNGLHPDGTPITGNDPRDTSRAIAPSFATGWMAHLAVVAGTAGNGGVRLYALDNEPTLWNSTHRDVHPQPTTYDELWQQTSQYAAAIKAQDPAAQVLGPADWGWCAYFFSAADGCQAGADAQAHGGLALTDWYLLQAADYQAAHGVRLIDYLDVHYYPQAAGVALSDDESASTAALRLRSLKGLYDPTYTDESWIAQPVELIPRMKAWIAGRLPGTRLAISEYNWGNDHGASSALAQAEALAIFGREGVDLAARWEAPAAGSRVEDAFLLYLDFDGKGAKVAGDSIRAASSDVDKVGAYAVAGAGSRLHLLLFNKDSVSNTVQVQVAGSPSATLDLYEFDASHRFGPAGTASLAAGAVTLTLPPLSATLAVTAGPPAAPASFYTLPPCRVLDTRNPNGAWAGPALASGTQRSFPLAGRCGVPATARAVSANLTVTGGTGGGDLRVFAADLAAAPVTSSINFASGQTRANNAVIGVSHDGNAAVTVLSEMAGGAVHLVLDVNGYFQ